MNLVLNKEPVKRVEKSIKEFDPSLNIICLQQSARTAQDAATALGCSVGAIVKSLLLKAGENFILCLVSGDKRCSLKTLKKILNEKDVSMANPDDVKKITGYTIGGVSPVGHLSTVKIYVDIPHGVDNNEIIMIPNEGHVLHDRCIGDIKVIVNVENDSIFQRQGLDLIMNKTISLKECLCGFTFELKHLNGKVYTMTNQTGNVICPGHTKTLVGMGIPRGDKIGKMIIIFGVEFPNKIDVEVSEKIAELL